jgi:hypothetical protein
LPSFPTTEQGETGLVLIMDRDLEGKSDKKTGGEKVSAYCFIILSLEN